MPFESKAQMRYMFAKHPRIAKRWADEQKSEGKPFETMPEKKRIKDSAVKKTANDHGYGVGSERADPFMFSSLEGAGAGGGAHTYLGHREREALGRAIRLKRNRAGEVIGERDSNAKLANKP